MKHLSEILEAARARGRKRVAVVYGQDSHTLQAVYDAYKEGIAEPVVYGSRTVIEGVCAELNIPLDVLTIVDEPSDAKCAELAVKAVGAGEADILMKGLISSDKYLRAILHEPAVFTPKGVLSHVAVVEWPGYDKLVLVSDVAVIPAPDFKQKVKMISYMGNVARVLGVDCPKIACVTPSEQVLYGVTSSMESCMLAKMSERGQMGNVEVDGPLSLDVALFKEVAEHKKVKGCTMAGNVDGLLFPNIEAANTFFKAVSHMAGGELAATLAGPKVPCILTSRGDSAASKMYSIALACLQVK